MLCRHKVDFTIMLPYPSHIRIRHACKVAQVRTHSVAVHTGLHMPHNNETGGLQGEGEQSTEHRSTSTCSTW